MTEIPPAIVIAELRHDLEVAHQRIAHTGAKAREMRADVTRYRDMVEVLAGALQTIRTKAYAPTDDPAAVLGQIADDAASVLDRTIDQAPDPLARGR